MHDPTTASLPAFLHWLSAQTGFPRHRLPPAAERLLLTAVAAAEETEGRARTPSLRETRDSARESALRAHTLRRSQAHFKCDNGVKV